MHHFTMAHWHSHIITNIYTKSGSKILFLSKKSSKVHVSISFFQICSLASWMTYYILVITIIIPVLLCAILNLIIYNYVTSSTKRIQPQSRASTGHTIEQQGKFNQRDIHLLRHMIIMFLVFVVGWSPIFIVSTVMTTNAVSSLILRIFSLLAELSLLCDIIDLFLYSHNLKIALKRIIPCYNQ